MNMQNAKFLFVNPSPGFSSYHELIRIRTRKTLQFIDLTKRVQTIINETGYDSGFVNIQSLHTTASIIVNENEPLLIQDMKRMLERHAPRKAKYQHDDFSIRTVNLQPGEPANGHAHCKALLLSPSQTLNIADGHLVIGRWQRVFFVELDSARDRTISVQILGLKGSE
jgi:secondary thiamine-phosphate synthase enzyme